MYVERTLRLQYYSSTSPRHFTQYRGKLEQKLLANDLPKKTVTAIRILYKNTKAEVHSPDGDTDYFDIVKGVLQGGTLASYLFIICLDYEL